MTPGVLTQWMEWEMTLGQMQGAVREGSPREVQPVQRPGQTSCISRPGSAWLAGVRQERWLH